MPAPRRKARAQRLRQVLGPRRFEKLQMEHRLSMHATVADPGRRRLLSEILDAETTRELTEVLATGVTCYS